METVSSSDALPVGGDVTFIQPVSGADVTFIEPAIAAPGRPSKRRKQPDAPKTSRAPDDEGDPKSGDASGAATPDSLPMALVKKVIVEHLHKQVPPVRCGGGFIEALNAAALEIVDEAVSRAMANQRQTVKVCDL